MGHRSFTWILAFLLLATTSRVGLAEADPNTNTESSQTVQLEGVRPNPPSASGALDELTKLGQVVGQGIGTSLLGIGSTALAAAKAARIGGGKAPTVGESLGEGVVAPGQEGQVGIAGLPVSLENLSANEAPGATPITEDISRGPDLFPGVVTTPSAPPIRDSVFSPGGTVPSDSPRGGNPASGETPPPLAPTAHLGGSVPNSIEPLVPQKANETPDPIPGANAPITFISKLPDAIDVGTVDLRPQGQENKATPNASLDSAESTVSSSPPRLIRAGETGASPSTGSVETAPTLTPAKGAMEREDSSKVMGDLTSLLSSSRELPRPTGSEKEVLTPGSETKEETSSAIPRLVEKWGKFSFADLPLTTAVGKQMIFRAWRVLESLDLSPVAASSPGGNWQRFTLPIRALWSGLFGASAAPGLVPAVNHGQAILLLVFTLNLLVVGSLVYLLLRRRSAAKERSRATSLLIGAPVLKRRLISLVLIGSAFASVVAEAGTIADRVPAPTAAAYPGNGDAYSGGDKLDGRLLATRERLNDALVLLEAGFEEDALCSDKECGASGRDGALCRLLRSLSEPQRVFCRQFLLRHAARLARENTDQRTPLHVVSAPLRVKVPSSSDRGHYRTVSAVTRHDSSEGIFFNDARVRSFTASELVALMAHELIHRAGVPGRIDDDAPFPPFSQGRRFLDSVGAALAVYSAGRSVPRQLAPGLPGGQARRDLCSLGRDGVSRFLLGMAWDTTRRALSHDELQRVKFGLGRSNGDVTGWVRLALASSAARSLALAGLFEKYLQRAPQSGESEVMLARLAEGVPYEVIVASLMGDAEYAQVRGATTTEALSESWYFDWFGQAPDWQTKESLVKLNVFPDNASRALAILQRSADKAWRRWVSEWYASYLNRVPEPRELDLAVDRLRSGIGWESVKAEVLSGREYSALQALRWRSCGGAALAVVEESRTNDRGAP